MPRQAINESEFIRALRDAAARNSVRSGRSPDPWTLDDPPVIDEMPPIVLTQEDINHAVDARNHFFYSLGVRNRLPAVAMLPPWVRDLPDGRSRAAFYRGENVWLYGHGFKSFGIVSKAWIDRVESNRRLRPEGRGNAWWRPDDPVTFRPRAYIASDWYSSSGSNPGVQYP